jgi:hypothetical protein
MTSIIKANSQFRHLSEDEVLRALRDPDSENPIACEVARLIAAYTENFAVYVERLGRFPPQILCAKSATAIEEVAMRLTTDAIRDAVAEAMQAD